MIAALYGKSMLSFIRNCHTVFHNGCTVFHFHQYWMRVSHPHQHLVLSALHILAILNRLTVVSHFNLHFRDDLWCGASFHRLIFHLYIFFGDVRVLGSLAIFNRVVYFLFDFQSSLCILDDNPLSGVFCKYSPPTHICCGLVSEPSLAPRYQNVKVAYVK